MSLEAMRQIFESQGFVTRAGLAPFDLLAESERVFVAIKQFTHIEEMLGQWNDVQARVASEFYGPNGLQDEKLWDSYLVLVCPGLGELTPDLAMKVDDIHGNMAYCRKLLLDTVVLADEERLQNKLSALFSVTAVGVRQRFDPLEALRQKLQEAGVADALLSLLDETDVEQLVQRAKAGIQA